jgi:hypothetical protein
VRGDVLLHPHVQARRRASAHAAGAFSDMIANEGEYSYQMIDYKQVNHILLKSVD